MKVFKIGLIADCLRLPFRESIEKSAQLGAEGVQLYAVSGEMAPENMTRQDIVEKRSILDANGLKVSALCGDLGGHGFTIEEDNQWKIERSKKIVDLALELGSNIVTTHIGVVPRDKTSRTYKVLQEACNELAEYAHCLLYTSLISDRSTLPCWLLMATLFFIADTKTSPKLVSTSSSSLSGTLIFIFAACREWCL